mgnify:FL=1
MKLTVAGNTLFPCLFVIKQKGYTLTIDDGLMLHADKDDKSFIASSSEELLGLITMFESRGEDWAKWSAEEEVMYEMKKLYSE